LQIASETGNRYQEIYTLINLSALAGIVGDADSALQNADNAAVLAKEISDLSGEAWAKLYMGHAYLLQNDMEQARAAYQSSLDIRNELNQLSLSMEPIAGLVDACMHADDVEAASRKAGKLLEFIESGASLDGTDEPLRVYYTCFRYLEKVKDPRSGRILQKAKKLLEEQVSKFNNDAERKRCVENFPWRRAIRDTAQP